MKRWQQVARKYYWAVVGPLALLTIFGTVSRWDVADAELETFEGTFPILVHSSYKASVSGSSRTVRRTQTYLLLPTTLDIPYTVTVQDLNGAITVEKDRYALLKYVVVVFVVLPLLGIGVQKLRRARSPKP